MRASELAVVQLKTGHPQVAQSGVAQLEVVRPGIIVCRGVRSQVVQKGGKRPHGKGTKLVRADAEAQRAGGARTRVVSHYRHRAEGHEHGTERAPQRVCTATTKKSARHRSQRT